MIVTIEGSVSATRTFDLTDIDQLHDIAEATYELRNGSGRSQSTPVADALSLRALVSAVQLPAGGTVDPAAVTFVEVVDDAGKSHPLSGSDLGPAGANGFEDGLMPAVFPNPTANAIGYVRPLRDGQDVNVSADPSRNGWLSVAAPAALQVVVHTDGTLLSPTITASTVTPQLDAEATFTVTFPTAPSTPLTYTWDFWDGTTSTQSAPRHRWTTAGTYYVNVTVRGADGSYGRAAPITVAVQPKRATATDVPSGGTGTDDDANSPVVGPHRGHGTKSGGATTGGSATGDAASTTTASTAPAPGPAPTPTPAPSPVAEPGERIEGITLVAAAAGTSGSAAVIPPAAAAPARAAAVHHLGVPGWVGLPLALLALVGSGALAESGAWRRLATRTKGRTTAR